VGLKTRVNRLLDGQGEPGRCPLAPRVVKVFELEGDLDLPFAALPPAPACPACGQRHESHRVVRLDGDAPP
jgi:hypothetical protein